MRPLSDQSADEWEPETQSTGQTGRLDEGGVMDQPIAEEALRRLEALVGRWKLVIIGADGQPWPGEAGATFEWHGSRAHLVARSHIDLPEAPSSISIIG